MLGQIFLCSSACVSEHRGQQCQMHRSDQYGQSSASVIPFTTFTAAVTLTNICFWKLIFGYTTLRTPSTIHFKTFPGSYSQHWLIREWSSCKGRCTHPFLIVKEHRENCKVISLEIKVRLKRYVRAQPILLQPTWRQIAQGDVGLQR